ncbi:MAG: DUF4232 domain-containing protein [Candidatus Dormibacteria bacterium]
MRGSLAGSMVLALGLLLAACGNATPSATPTPRTSSPGTGSSPSPSPANVSPSPSNPSVLVACSTSQLVASLANGQGAAGSIIYDLEFKNVSSTSCTLYGNPGVSMVAGSAGSQVGAAAVFVNQSSATTVTLPSGGSANALLQVAQAGNYPSSSCGITSVAGLRVYPPGQTAALFIPQKGLQGCRDSKALLLQVGPVQS